MDPNDIFQMFFGGGMGGMGNSNFSRFTNGGGGKNGQSYTFRFG